MNSNKPYHIGITKEDIKNAKYAILPGDPGRVRLIASLMDNPVFLNQSREYTSYLAKTNNEYVLIISTGMGGPSAAICMEELHQIGIENVIRVGTCGGMQKDIMAGDVVVASAAIRAEGTSKEYLPIEYPAVSDFNITNTLRKSANDLNLKAYVGVVHSKDSFYGQHSPERMPVGYELQNKWGAFIKCGSLASEMETAAIFSVASVLRMKAGSVLLVIWNQERNDNKECHDELIPAKIAIKTINKLTKNKN